MFPLKPVGESPPLPFLASSGLLAVCGIPWLAAALLQSLTSLSNGVLAVRLYVHMATSYGHQSYWIKGQLYPHMTSS